MEKKKTVKSDAEKTEKINFEKALQQLEEIAEKLEDGDLGLDESINQFEKGMRLAKFCREKLDEAERKIEILQKGADGHVRKKEVDVDDGTGEIKNEDDLQGSLL
ncbi:MAG TPA: exodeoxyribonuclease VII small subunit [Spirochaetota bacterium]|nr:exodeoxyribonuclease VII small subunit [Spirochaetota bacterium]HPC39296.1 exodeoxyribonuclease VII small subunit [Spirochaetota bacterium]HPL16839.1 exodeoxyribonuclease VII small subunit [Spirochaetota bacterium]HQF08766.1 exodeoxyribonuclease VII small subunit [Spirochaetota bacterium]HQH97533.1 exodeoxyribonuclease VII small subunit [Spirochaetota bacterium]